MIAGQRHRHPDDGPERVRERFADGEVRYLDGSRVADDDVLRPGTDIWFYRIPAPEDPIGGTLATLYEDDCLLVVDKPPFMAVLPRGMHVTETALVKLRRATRNDNLVPVHRLDRLTSGVLVFSKRPSDRGMLQRQFAERTVKKTYEALTMWPNSDIRIETTPFDIALCLKKTRGTLRTVVTDGAPNSVTRVRSVVALEGDGAIEMGPYQSEASTQLALWNLEPLTGRTHQLRVSLAAIGAPILGDVLYADGADQRPISSPIGSPVATPLCLVATSLSLTHPVSGENVGFASHRRPWACGAGCV